MIRLRVGGWVVWQTNGKQRQVFAGCHLTTVKEERLCWYNLYNLQQKYQSQVVRNTFSHSGEIQLAIFKKNTAGSHLPPVKEESLCR